VRGSFRTRDPLEDRRPDLAAHLVRPLMPSHLAIMSRPP
jgi:hypothetical protein